MKNQHVLWAILAVLLFSFCKNDDDFSPQDPNMDVNTGELITTTITGLVFDENNLAVVDAEVILGNNSTTTDANGVFIFRDVQTRSRDTYLTVEKDGFFHSSKRIYPGGSSSMKLRFQLLSNNIIGSISAATGGEVSLTNGAKIILPANGIETMDGASFTGNVNISMHHIGPNAEDLSEKMPGDLTGLDQNGELQALGSFGMIGVELSDDSGAPLQVAGGSEATLRFPVPSELTSNAPSSIPLWHFDEELGRWIEEGSASLEGNEYVGNVSHFSFWNCDIPHPYVYMNGTFVDASGAPVPNIYIRAVINSSGLSASGYTDSEGVFEGIVPQDEALTLEFYWMTLSCQSSTPIFTHEVGPFSEDTNVGTIAFSDNSIVNINGTLSNCTGSPIQNGYVKVIINDGIDFVIAEDGNINGMITVCPFDEMTALAYDLDGFKVSDPQTFSYSQNIDIGTIAICEDDLTEYLSYTLAGESFLHIDPLVNHNQTQTMVAGTDEGVAQIGLLFDGQNNGVFPIMLGSYANSESIKINSSSSITIYNYGAPGEFIIGSFSGTVNVNGETEVIEGEFKILNTVSSSALCTIEETSFVGTYLLESVQGNENCFGTVYQDNVNVTLSYVSENVRSATFSYLVDITDDGFDVEVDFYFTCGEIFIPLINTGVGCSSSILQLGSTPLETYDPNDDSVFQFNITDFANQDCSCPSVNDNIYKLTKQ